MISEHDARIEWRNLFGRNAQLSARTFKDAQQLIERLPPESPLRPLLSVELGELLSLSKDRAKKG